MVIERCTTVHDAPARLEGAHGGDPRRLRLGRARAAGEAVREGVRAQVHQHEADVPDPEPAQHTLQEEHGVAVPSTVHASSEEKAPTADAEGGEAGRGRGTH